MLDGQDALPTGEPRSFSYKSLTLATRARMAETNKAHWIRYNTEQHRAAPEQHQSGTARPQCAR